MKLRLFAIALSAVAGNIVLVPAVHAGATSEAAPITVEDLLHGASLGAAQFSPDSTHLVYSIADSTADASTQGYANASIVSQRLFVVPRSGSDAREITGRPGARYYIGQIDPWAPDGRGMLTIETFDGISRLAYRDTTTGRVTTLPGKPESYVPTFAWAGDQLLYTSVGEDTPQRLASVQFAAYANERWRGAWSGTSTEVTVDSANPLFQSSVRKPGALMAFDRSTNQTVMLAEGDYASVYASPDGRRVAAVRLLENVADALTIEGRRGRVEIFEFRAGGARRVAAADGLDIHHQAVVWSASGDRLLVGARSVGESRERLRLFEIDRAGRPRELALPHGASPIQRAASWDRALLQIGWIDDEPVAILGHPGDAASAASMGSRLEYGENRNLRFDLFAFRRNRPAELLTGFAKASITSFLTPKAADFALVIADRALWRLRPGKAAERLSPQSTQVMAVAGNPRQTSGVYYNAKGAERIALVTMAPGKGPQRQVLDLDTQTFAPPGPFGLASPDLETVVTGGQSGWATYLTLLEGGAERRLATVNAELEHRLIAPTERFTFKAGGQELTGWLMLPPGAPRDKPLPAVVVVYGGAVYGGSPPSGADAEITSPVLSGQLLAAQGYAVIYPSMPTGSGADSNVMATLAEQAVAAVDAVAAAGTIDPKRVGLLGQSYGGYSVAAILAERSDRFAAGIAAAGIFDWMHAYANPSLGDVLSADDRDRSYLVTVVEETQIRLGKPFWLDPEAYIRNSPAFHVDKINAPLLLLQGDFDLNASSIAGAQRMYDALVRAGKQPALVRYWGEGHLARSAGAVRDQWSRIATWFDAYLRKQ